MGKRQAHKSIVSMEWGSGDGSGVERRGVAFLHDLGMEGDVMVFYVVY